MSEVFLDKRYHVISKDPKHFESMTKQSFRDEVDINAIVGRYIKTGLFPLMNGEPFYGDVSEVGDYHEAMNRVTAANELFAQMPANIRERFGNDPGEMIAFLSDRKNQQEAEDLGMALKRPVVAVEPVKVVEPIVPTVPVK